jgi:uncharacterized protein YndB with AHSA1/START domain
VPKSKISWHLFCVFLDMEHIVKKRIRIRAKPDKVWRALTDPEITKKYFYNCGVYSDWKPGSNIQFKGRMFLIKKIEMNGKILDVEPNKLLRYSLRNEGEHVHNSFSVVTDEMYYEDGLTVLTITDDVGSGKGAEKRYQRSLKGWDKILKGLKKVVEND